MKKIIFLDRDGVITQDPPHYAHRLDQLKIIPGSAEAISLLKKAGYTIAVITNQSGVAKGIYTEEDIHIFNNEMIKQLKESGGDIDAVYYCPHHPEASDPKYKKTCSCRKPNPGMIHKAEKDFGISAEGSYLIGDKHTDILAGKAAGCRTILVLTGHGKLEYDAAKHDADYISNELLSAVKDIILKNKNEDILRHSKL